MEKDFCHTCNLRNSNKVLELRRVHNAAGYGIYNMLLEKLCEQNNLCTKDYDAIAYDLRTDTEIVKSVVEDFGLFSFTDDNSFYSELLIGSEGYNLSHTAEKSFDMLSKSEKRSKRLSDARKRGTHTEEQWKEMKDFFGECLICGSKNFIVKNHIIPIYQGGSDSITNIQPLCSCCSRKMKSITHDYRVDFCKKKHLKMPSVWRCEETSNDVSKMSNDVSMMSKKGLKTSNDVLMMSDDVSKMSNDVLMMSDDVSKTSDDVSKMSDDVSMMSKKGLTTQNERENEKEEKESFPPTPPIKEKEKKEKEKHPLGLIRPTPPLSTLEAEPLLLTPPQEDDRPMAAIRADMAKYFNNAIEKARSTIPKVLIPKGGSCNQWKFFDARYKEHGEEVIKQVIEKAVYSRFLNGDNNRGFRATFEWLMRPSNFPKVAAGNYDNQNQSTYYAPRYNDRDAERNRRAQEAAELMQELMATNKLTQ